MTDNLEHQLARAGRLLDELAIAQPNPPLTRTKQTSRWLRPAAIAATAAILIAGLAAIALHRPRGTATDPPNTSHPTATSGPPTPTIDVTQILEGIPLPPGLAANDVIASVGDEHDAYQATARATSAVVCGWITTWMHAKAVDDASGVDTAVQALSTSRTWPALLAIEQQGHWSAVVWEYADAVAGRAALPGGVNGLTVDDTYQQALGCSPAGG